METEIKLGPVPPETARRAYEDTVLLPPAGEGRTLQMETVYYDSPAGALAARRQMVRLRRENGAGVCTFKGPAQGFSRLELECPAEDIRSGAAALAALPQLPEDAREALASGKLSPVCGVSFTRETRPCRVEDTAFSLCLDRGFLKKGTARQAFCELELELTAGNLSDLTRTAEALCRAYGLEVCRLSKQQRAMALEEEP